MKTALVTGVGGQDGSYLAEFLLEKGYKVAGVVRQSSVVNTQRLAGFLDHPNFELCVNDITDGAGMELVMSRVQPDEVYHLAAQSHVGHSFRTPEVTARVDGIGTVQVLEAARQVGQKKEVKFYQASTSELFGKAVEQPQNEDTPLQPRSPYAIAKLYAYWMVRNYREAYGMFAANGILFNHESPRRGRHFVTRKITLGLARIKHGYQDVLHLGNLSAKRDWGYAGDYVDAMWRILQHDVADDFVISSGQSHTVRDFVNAACAALDMPISWDGEGQEEQARCAKTGKVLVAVDPKFYRPTEVQELCGDASKAERELGWKAETPFDALVEMMAKSDADRVVREKGAVSY